jgi:predicted transcriptional regulators
MNTRGEDMFILGERIGQLRNRNNISQKKLAEILHVSRTSICSWEAGTAYPTAQYLAALARYFHVTTDYLLGIDTEEILKIDKLNATEKELVLNLIHYFEQQKEENGK